MQHVSRSAGVVAVAILSSRTTFVSLSRARSRIWARPLYHREDGSGVI
jgi:hypothetical protein